MLRSASTNKSRLEMNRLCTLKVKQWLVDNAESKHAAVYTVFGKDEQVKFVGVSRNVVLSLAAHVAIEGGDKVHLLKVRSGIHNLWS